MSEQGGAGARGVSLRVTVELAESKGAKEVPRAVVYAFSAGGRLLAVDEVDAKGAAALTVPALDSPQRIQVMAGPRVEKEMATVTELKRRGAEYQFLRVDPGTRESLVEMQIIPPQWLCWLLSGCVVRGRLLQRTERDGIWIDLPVCHALVEVYEVDPWPIIVLQLADYDIERIRHKLLETIRREQIHEIPFERIPPKRGPGPDPGPLGEPVPIPIPTPEPLPAQPQSPVGAIPAGLQYVVETGNTDQLRQGLRSYADIVRPLLCWLHFPVLKKLVAKAKTDSCGRFKAIFFRGCGNPDQPDLYFKAKQKTFASPPPFSPVTIYEPKPVSCYTHWNYQCGSEVTLHTRHPKARTCSPCLPVNAPPDWVLVLAIGNHPLSGIYGTSEDLEGSTTDQNRGLTDAGAPFGGLLRPRIEFDNSLREKLGVMYYRVSYRKQPANPLAEKPPYAPLSGAVVRHYTYEVGEDLVLAVFPLGPCVVNGTADLFEIPPALPPKGQWSLPNVVEDTSSAKFPTADLAPAAEHGKYQLKVELFDAKGKAVDIGDKGIKYRVPDVGDMSGDIETSDAADLELVDGNSFVMTLHIDNNVCSAAIPAPTLNGVAAGDDCGVMPYDPSAPGSVTMTYAPTHPNGFGTYKFHVRRGVHVLSLPPGTAPTLPDEGTAVPSPGVKSNTQTTTDLLSECSIAGFSEHLSVWATATNGWSYLREYDAHTSRAFVLAPKPPESSETP